MATRIKSPPEPLYDADFYAWSRRQAELLRARLFDELDLDNLTQEVEDLGGALYRSASSRIRTIIEHLLKLEHSSAQAPRSGWRATVRVQRDDLGDDLTPTLERLVAAELPRLYRQARRRTAADPRDHGEDAAADALPETCPYGFAPIPGDWLP